MKRPGMPPKAVKCRSQNVWTKTGAACLNGPVAFPRIFGNMYLRKCPKNSPAVAFLGTPQNVLRLLDWALNC